MHVESLNYSEYAGLVIKLSSFVKPPLKTLLTSPLVPRQYALQAFLFDEHCGDYSEAGKDLFGYVKEVKIHPNADHPSMSGFHCLCCQISNLMPRWKFVVLARDNICLGI